MTDDLVKRLRDTANSGGYDIYGLHCDIELEAADRIEKLGAALRAVIDWDNCLDWEEEPAWGDVMDTVRKALEGKDV